MSGQMFGGRSRCCYISTSSGKSNSSRRPKLCKAYAKSKRRWRTLLRTLGLIRNKCKISAHVAFNCLRVRRSRDQQLLLSFASALTSSKWCNWPRGARGRVIMKRSVVCRDRCWERSFLLFQLDWTDSSFRLELSFFSAKDALIWCYDNPEIVANEMVVTRLILVHLRKM